MRYGLFYRSTLCQTSNVYGKLEKIAWRLAKEKGWDVTELLIKGLCPEGAHS